MLAIVLFIELVIITALYAVKAQPQDGGYFQRIGKAFAYLVVGNAFLIGVLIAAFKFMGVPIIGIL